MRARRFVGVAVIGLTVAMLAPTAAQAGGRAPRAPRFGPLIETDGDYDGQTKCSPGAKPGVLAFQSMVLRTYPGTGAGSIGRACSSGGQSEHKEGRAWDWGVNIGVPSQRKAAADLIKWLTATDEYGNEAAMARRLGLMYMIWNRKIWFPWGGWETYCVEKKGACRDPEDGGTRHPHTDHVHFSFTWAGARKETSFWNPEGTRVAGIAPHPEGYGYWILGRNGGVIPSGTGYYGSKGDDHVKEPVVAMTSTPSGDGYWLTSKSGKVWAFGDAPRRGSLDDGGNVVAIAAHPSGKGYWLLSGSGKVSAFGRAQELGSAWKGTSSAVSLTSTATGKGYWVVTKSGEVFAFGDALKLGIPKKMNNVVSIASTPTGLGYWVAAANGRVSGFGDAAKLGGLKKGKVIGLVPTQSGLGYWLVQDDMSSADFGDAWDR